ncbi:hypothetical protein D4764_01G0004810 [Takifugu flavidus]|uniref:Taste receptor type 2 n=1 Tax=Takifugu flavidus TaxID=433684 RepID=A0A5C6PP82_9TELE|nr:hypothetical protein D4764_01G0004810 [Takifugu flavidus]
MSAIVLNILINAFYIACLVRPFRGETPKQPLSLLLWTMLCCNLSFQALSTSMTTTVWLNFFYFIQIVPLKSPVFLWMKRNHKATIYCIWMVEKLIIGITVTSIVMFDVSVFSQISDLMSFNATFNSDTVFNKLPSHLIKLAKATMIMNEVYFVICLFIMSLSSLSTAIYLSRHLRQMASKVRSCSLFRSQVRVTVTGILQGALYVLLSTWILSHYLFYDIAAGPAAYMTLANITVINVYMMGTICKSGGGSGRVQAESCGPVAQSGTPALTKAFKDGPGIHSCPSSAGMDSEGTATCCSELKVPDEMKSVDDDDLQKLLPCLPLDVFSLSQDQVVLLPYASPLPFLLSADSPARARGLSRTPASSQAETKQRDYSPVVVPTSTWIQGEEGPMGSLSPPLQQSFCSRSTSERPRVMLTDALRPRLSRQVGLRGKAQRLQRRLQSHLHPSDPLPTLTEPSVDLPSLGEFSQSSQAVLRGLQGALDSEATLSSSSDDESQEVRGRSGAADLATRFPTVGDGSAVWTWLAKVNGEVTESDRETH